MISPAIMLDRDIQTIGLKTAMSARRARPNIFGKTQIAVAISPADKNAIRTRYHVKGIQSQIRLTKPVIVRARIGSVSASKIVSPGIAKTAISTALKRVKALGTDFLRTIGIKSPIIFLSFGSNVSIRGGRPITNISKIKIFRGEKG